MEIDGFRGRLITADDAEYDTARAVWNGAVDRYPKLIARCSGTADVTAACASPASTTWRSPYGAEATTWPARRCATTGSSSTSRRCAPFRSTPPAARPGCRGVPCGATSTTRRSPMVWPPPAASWATPVSPGSRLAVASAFSCANTGSPSTTSWPPRWSPPRAASSGRPPTNTPICSGRCEAAAATSASSPRSGSRCTLSARP